MVHVMTHDLNSKRDADHEFIKIYIYIYNDPILSTGNCTVNHPQFIRVGSSLWSGLGLGWAGRKSKRSIARESTSVGEFGKRTSRVGR
jgi:hypothetical protein